MGSTARYCLGGLPPCLKDCYVPDSRSCCNCPPGRAGRVRYPDRIPSQRVLVQTVLDHREVAGAGCILQNDAGKWFVTTPARVAIRKSVGQLRVDCRLDDAAWAYENIKSKQNSTLWQRRRRRASASWWTATRGRDSTTRTC